MTAVSAARSGSRARTASVRSCPISLSTVCATGAANGDVNADMVGLASPPGGRCAGPTASWRSATGAASSMSNPVSWLLRALCSCLGNGSSTYGGAMRTWLHPGVNQPPDRRRRRRRRSAARGAGKVPSGGSSPLGPDGRRQADRCPADRPALAEAGRVSATRSSTPVGEDADRRDADRGRTSRLVVGPPLALMVYGASAVE